MIRLLLASCLLAVACSANAGPFGINMGDEPESAKFKNFTPIDGSPGYLIGANPPKSHSAFEKYVVRFSQESGACWVKAIGKDIKNDSYGIQTRSTIDNIAAQLSKKYGSSDKTDRLMSGSIWDEPDEWLTGINKNERFYIYQWDADTGAQFGDTGLTSIFLTADSNGRSDGYPNLEFYFQNHAKCKAEKSQREEDAF